MRIVLGIFSRNDKILQIEKSLKNIGHEVRTVYTDSYYSVCPYYKKKMDKLGFHADRIKYQEKLKEKLYQTVDSFSAELVLFVNIPTDIIMPEDLIRIYSKCKIACWFVDGIDRRVNISQYLLYFDKTFVFEECDIKYVKQFGMEANYLPVGYGESFKKTASVKDIDICFIGSPFSNRLKILENIARVAEYRSWKLKIFGPFYDTSYPWKKLLFKYKYPYISKFLDNRVVSTIEASGIYNRTKICLNIHSENHKSPNPRTFDIMATGSFELMDYREYPGDLSEDDCAFYNDADDIIEKIDFYLHNDAIREKKAKHGYRKVIDKISMKSVLGRLIDEVKDMKRV